MTMNDCPDTFPAKPLIRTVLGDIAPQRLGITHAHEHTIILPGKSSEINPALRLDDPEAAIAELGDFKAAGGCALVDAQPIGVERSPELMRLVSERSGVTIIATSGFHRARFYPENHFLFTDGVESLARRIETEITAGMIDDSSGGRTNIKAGLIKFTSEYHHIPPVMQKAAQAAAMAHLATGAPVLTHTEHGTCGPEQVELAEKYGIKPRSLLLSHLDRNPDRFLHKEIASTGAFLVYDGIARTKYWPDATIIDLIREMIDAGYAGRILLGMDLATRTSWIRYGYGPGLSYLLKRFVPNLRKAGIEERYIHAFLVENPAQALSFSARRVSGQVPDDRFCPPFDNPAPKMV